MDELKEQNRYKRLFKMTGDYSWMAKYAESMKEPPKTAQSGPPNIDQFITEMTAANAADFEDDPHYGILGQVAARVLSGFYRENIDGNNPAYGLEFNPDFKKGLSEELLSFAPDELQLLQDAIREQVRQVADEGISAATELLTPEATMELIEFTLLRGYLLSYANFLFRNPKINLELQNKDYVPEIPAEPVEIPPEKEIALSSKMWDAFFKNAADEETDKKEPKERVHKGKGIHEGGGTKVRLSQAIVAFKIQRAKKAHAYAMSKENRNALLLDLIKIDALVENLEATHRGIIEYIDEDPRRKYHQWFGQSLAEGDPFIINLGREYDTFDKMMPEQMKFFLFRKGKAIPVYVKYNKFGKEENIKKLTPDAEEIYNLYAGEKFSNGLEKAKAYISELSTKYIADVKIAKDTQVSVRKKEQSQLTEKQLEILKQALDPVPPETLIALGNAVFAQVSHEYDGIYKNITAEKYSQTLKEFVRTLAAWSTGITSIQPLLRTNANETFARLIRDILSEFLVIPDMDLLEESLYGDNHYGFLMTEPYDEKTLKNKWAQLPKDKEERAKIIADIYILINDKTRDHDIKIGFDPKMGRRNSEDYAGVLTLIQSEVNKRYYSSVLPPGPPKKSKKRKPEEEINPKGFNPAKILNELVRSLALSRFPDAYGTSAVGIFFNRAKNVMASDVKDIRQALIARFDQFRDVHEEEFEEEQQAYEPENMLTDLYSEPLKEGVAILEAKRDLLEKNGWPSSKKNYKPRAETMKKIEARVAQMKGEDLEFYSDKVNQERLGKLDEMKSFLASLRMKIKDFNAMKSQGVEQDYFVKQFLDHHFPDDDIDSRCFYIFAAKEIMVCMAFIFEHQIPKVFSGARVTIGDGSYIKTMLAHDAAEAAAMDDGEGGTTFDAHAGLFSYQQGAEDMSYGKEEGKRKSRQEIKIELAKGEFDNWFQAATSEKELYRLGFTRESRHEEEGDPRREYDLPGSRFAGQVKFFMGYTRSGSPEDKANETSYFDKMFDNDDPMVFANHTIQIAKMNMGAAINRILTERVNEWLAAGPHKSVSKFMEAIKVFPHPLINIAPNSSAFKNLEQVKVQSGARWDKTDSCKYHFERAMRACHPIDNQFQAKMEAYFEHSAESIVNELNKNADQSLDKEAVRKAIILPYHHVEGVSVVANPTNDPFSKYSPAKMFELLRSVMITDEHLNRYFDQQKKINELFAEANVEPNIEDRSSTDEAMIRARMTDNMALSESLSYNIVNWGTAMDLIFKTPVQESQRAELNDIARKIKNKIAREIGKDSSQYKIVFRNTFTFTEKVFAVLDQMPDTKVADAIRQHLLEATGRVKESADLTGTSPDDSTLDPNAEEQDLKAMHSEITPAEIELPELSKEDVEQADSTVVDTEDEDGDPETKDAEELEAALPDNIVEPEATEEAAESFNPEQESEFIDEVVPEPTGVPELLALADQLETSMLAKFQPWLNDTQTKPYAEKTLKNVKVVADALRNVKINEVMFPDGIARVEDVIVNRYPVSKPDILAGRVFATDKVQTLINQFFDFMSIQKMAKAQSTKINKNTAIRQDDAAYYL